MQTTTKVLRLRLKAQCRLLHYDGIEMGSKEMKVLLSGFASGFQLGYRTIESAYRSTYE